MRIVPALVLSTGLLLVGCGAEPLRPNLPPVDKPSLSLLPYDTTALAKRLDFSGKRRTTSRRRRRPSAPTGL